MPVPTPLLTASGSRINSTPRKRNYGSQSRRSLTRRGVGQGRSRQRRWRSAPALSRHAPCQRASFEMTEAQLLLELLVRRLADPTRFHAGHQPTLWRRWRQIAQVVFALAARAPLADQPDFLSR